MCVGQCQLSKRVHGDLFARSVVKLSKVRNIQICFNEWSNIKPPLITKLTMPVCWSVATIKKVFMMTSSSNLCSRGQRSEKCQFVSMRSQILNYLKEYSLVLTTSFYDIIQKILTRKGFQNFS